MTDWLQGILFQVSAGEVFWGFVRFVACPATVAFAVAKYNIYRESETRRRMQRRSILSFYKAVLEIDLPMLKNCLKQFEGESVPMPLVPLPFEVSLADLAMSHEENQFMADRLTQQLMLRSRFVSGAVLGKIDRKSVEDYCVFTEQSLGLLRKMFG